MEGSILKSICQEALYWFKLYLAITLTGGDKRIILYTCKFANKKRSTIKIINDEQQPVIDVQEKGIMYFYITCKKLRDEKTNNIIGVYKKAFAAGLK